MKIRTGFISNSSTSCFICAVYGEHKYKRKETVAILQKMLDFYNDLEGENISFEKAFKFPKKATKDDIELLSNWEIEESRVKGKTLIYSRNDNSIPWMLFGLIEDKFNAERIHLG
jgi:hypothetical protein